MINLNASAFLDKTQNDYMDKVRAEMYMLLYQYAAEDFTSHPDIAAYIRLVTSWMKSVDARLEKQMQLIASHTHKIPPHSHPGGKGGPIPLTTVVPSNASAIRWIAIPYPVYINTTLTIPNMTGNLIAVTMSSEGSPIPRVRRAKPIDLTLIPLLSPTLQDSLTGSLV